MLKLWRYFDTPKPRVEATWITCRKASSFAWFSKSLLVPSWGNEKEWSWSGKDFLKKSQCWTLWKKIESKKLNPKRWLRKLFEIPIGLAMCENWNSSKELRVRKMIFYLSLSLSLWFRGRVSGSVSALFSTRIGFSRFWGQISMLGAQNMTHQRVMNLWKPRIMLKDYLLGLYRKKIIGKAYFNTKHLPPKTGIFLKETVFAPSFLRFHVSNFQGWLPHGSRTRQELRRLSTSNRLRQTCCTKRRNVVQICG